MIPTEAFYHPDRQARQERRAAENAKTRALIERCRQIADYIKDQTASPDSGDAVLELCAFAEQALDDADY